MTTAQKIANLEEQATLALSYYRQLPPSDFRRHLETARDHDRFVAEANALRAEHGL